MYNCKGSEKCREFVESRKYLDYLPYDIKKILWTCDYRDILMDEPQYKIFTVQKYYNN
jgi:hypothetical protein